MKGTVGHPPQPGLPLTETDCAKLPDSQPDEVQNDHASTAQESMISPNVITYSSCVSAGLGGICFQIVFQVVFSAQWHVLLVWDVFCVQSRCLRNSIDSRMTWDMLKPLVRWGRICRSFVSRFPPSWLEEPFCPVWKTCIGTAQSIFAVLAVLLVGMFMPLCCKSLWFRRHISSWSLKRQRLWTLEPYCALRC